MTIRRRQHAFPAAMRGVGLLEVLIAVLVMGIGLLGIAALQTTALRNSQSALERSQAVIHSYAILDAMRANREAAADGQYNMAMSCTAPSGGGLVGQDRTAWMASLKRSLGDRATTCASIQCNNNVCDVGIRWDDARGSAGVNNYSFNTRTRL